MTTEIQKVEAEAKKVFSWGASHLVLVGCLALALVGGIYEYDSRRADKADMRAAVADAHAAAVVQANQAYQTQVQGQIAALVQTNQTLQAEIAALTQAMAARDAALPAQQKQDAALAPDQLAARWASLIKNQGNIHPIAGGYQADQTAALATTQALESIPVLTADRDDQAKQITNLNGIIGNLNQTVSLERSAHTSDNSACQAQLAAKDADIKKLKADNRKRNLKWFLFGGFVVEAAKLYLTNKF